MHERRGDEVRVYIPHTRGVGVVVERCENRDPQKRDRPPWRAGQYYRMKKNVELEGSKVTIGAIDRGSGPLYKPYAYRDSSIVGL